MKARVLPLILLFALPAYADSVRYEINFVATSGNPPASATFFYDVGEPRFIDFFITWQNTLFDFTFQANTFSRTPPNSPAGFHGNVPCVDGLTGAAAAFQFLNGACSNQPGFTTIWEAGAPVGGDLAFFWIRSFTLNTVDYIGDIDFALWSGGSAGAFGSSWTTTPSAATVPEPVSLTLLVVGSAAIFSIRSTLITRPRPW